MDWQQCETDANSLVCVQVKMEISCLHVTILGLPFLFLLSSKLIIQLFCLAVCHLLKSCKFVSGNSPHYSSVDAGTTQLRMDSYTLLNSHSQKRCWPSVLLMRFSVIVIKRRRVKHLLQPYDTEVCVTTDRKRCARLIAGILSGQPVLSSYHAEEWR